MNIIHNLYSSIKMMWRVSKGFTSLALISSVITAVIVPMTLYSIQFFVDGLSAGLHSGEYYSPIKWFSIYIGLEISASVLAYSTNLILYNLKEKVSISELQRIAEKFNGIDFSYFEDSDTNDTIKLMGEHPDEALTERFRSSINAIRYFISIFASTFFLAQLGWIFMASLVVLMLFTIALNYRGMAMMNDVIIEQSDQERKLQYILDILSNKDMLYELKIYSAVKYLVEKWKRIAKKVFKVRLDTIMRAQKYFIVTTLMFVLWMVCVTWLMIERLINNDLDLGFFTAFIASIGSVASISNMLSNELTFICRQSMEIEKYEQFMRYDEKADGKKDICGDGVIICFDNVTFKYPGTEKIILDDLSFTLDAGKRIALVGENGAGKSTIVKLILRLYKPDSGHIYINGVDINDVKQKDIAKIFGVIFQDYMRYEMTLRENVAMGSVEYMDDDKALIGALKQSMYGDVSSEELDQNLGKLSDMGIDVSGGQWQKIAFARALIGNSKCIILDEPTAALDPLTECRIYEAFNMIIEDKGSIMISHRLASAKLADDIIVIKDGKCAERGNHDELINMNGIYAHMYKVQSEWYKNNVNDGDKNEINKSNSKII